MQSEVYKNSPYLQFHSISTPRKVQDLNKNRITSQYEFHILYYLFKNGKAKFKKRQIYIGNKNVKTVNDGDMCNSLTKKGMRTKGKFIIISSPDFNKEIYKKSGGFLNKKFWSYNLLWDDSVPPEENFFKIQKQLWNDPELSFIQLPDNMQFKISARRLRSMYGKNGQTDKTEQEVTEDGLVKEKEDVNKG